MFKKRSFVRKRFVINVVLHYSYANADGNDRVSLSVLLRYGTENVMSGTVIEFNFFLFID